MIEPGWTNEIEKDIGAGNAVRLSIGMSDPCKGNIFPLWVIALWSRKLYSCKCICNLFVEIQILSQRSCLNQEYLITKFFIIIREDMNMCKRPEGTFCGGKKVEYGVKDA